MPVHFVLKRYLPEFGDMDLYEAIKTGKKTSEYRDATPYWAKRLLNEEGLSYYNSTIGCHTRRHIHNPPWTFPQRYLKHTEATFPRRLHPRPHTPRNNQRRALETTHKPVRDPHQKRERETTMTPTQLAALAILTIAALAVIIIYIRTWRKMMKLER